MGTLLLRKTLRYFIMNYSIFSSINICRLTVLCGSTLVLKRCPNARHASLTLWKIRCLLFWILQKPKGCCSNTVPVRDPIFRPCAHPKNGSRVEGRLPVLFRLWRDSMHSPVSSSPAGKPAAQQKWWSSILTIRILYSLLTAKLKKKRKPGHLSKQGTMAGSISAAVRTILFFIKTQITPFVWRMNSWKCCWKIKSGGPKQ